MMINDPFSRRHPYFPERIYGMAENSRTQIRVSVYLMVDRINYTQRINHRSHYFEFELTPRTILWERRETNYDGVTRISRRLLCPASSAHSSRLPLSRTRMENFARRVTAVTPAKQPRISHDRHDGVVYDGKTNARQTIVCARDSHPRKKRKLARCFLQI